MTLTALALAVPLPLLGCTDKAARAPTTSRGPRAFVRPPDAKAQAASYSPTRDKRQLLGRRRPKHPRSRYDEHRSLRLVQDRMRDATEQRTRNRAVATRADDDQVGRDGVRVRDDLVGNIAHQKFRLRVNSALLRHVHRVLERPPVG